MNVYDAMQQRRSIRAFLDKQIPRDVLTRVLENAMRAPSWKNCQPYELYVLEGQKKAELKDKLVEAAMARREENPDEPFQASWPTYMKKRMFSLGKALYDHLEIPREDKEGRARQMLRNFEFFDAPAVLFFFTPRNMGFWPEFDVGIFYGYVMLALLEEGLASCPQASLATYPDLVRDVLGLEKNNKLLAGMSIGYPDDGAKINAFQTEREPFEQMIRFIG